MGKLYSSPQTEEMAPETAVWDFATASAEALGLGGPSASLEEAREALACFEGDDTWDTWMLDTFGADAAATAETRSATTGEILDDVDAVREWALELPTWAADVVDSPGRAAADMVEPLPWQAEAVLPYATRGAQTVELPQGHEAAHLSRGAKETVAVIALVNGMMETGVGLGRLADGDYRGGYDVVQGLADATGAAAEFATPVGESCPYVPGAQIVSGGVDVVAGLDKYWSSDDTDVQAEGLTDVMKGTTAAASGAAFLAGAPAAPALAAGAAGMEVGEHVAAAGLEYSRERDYFGGNRSYAEWSGDLYREWSDDIGGPEILGDAVAFLPALGAGIGAGCYSFGRGVLEDLF